MITQETRKEIQDKIDESLQKYIGSICDIKIKNNIKADIIRIVKEYNLQMDEIIENINHDPINHIINIDFVTPNIDEV